jgi:hypothetical protein
LNETRWFYHAAASIVDSLELKRAFLRVFSEGEFFIAKSSCFRCVAKYIERNIPRSSFLAESSLLVVRRFMCNEAYA